MVSLSRYLVESNDRFNHLRVVLLVGSSHLFLEVRGHHHGYFLFGLGHDPLLFQVYSEKLSIGIGSLLFDDVPALVEIVEDASPIECTHWMNLARIQVEVVSS